MRTLQGIVVGSFVALALSPAVGLAKAPPPPPPDWQSAIRTDNQEAFYDAASAKTVGANLEVAVKYNYAAPQPFGKKTFQSARNVYRVDCAGRRLADRENVIYEAPDLQGKKLSTATRSEKNLIWRDAPRTSVDGRLLDHVCAKFSAAPVAAPGG